MSTRGDRVSAARRRGSALLVAVVAVVMLSACSGDDDAQADAGTTGHPGGRAASASPSGPSPAEKLTEQLLGSTADEPAVASSQASVTILGESYQLVADVLEVRANSETTLLRWRLKSASGQATKSLGFWLSEPPLFDSRGITLLDRAGNHALSPFTYNKDEHDCVCSQMPESVDGEGQPMYALYPPLDPSATTVDITLPGFPDMKDVPVTRS